MFRKISGLLILGLILASCGVTPVAGGLKDVSATSADGGVSVKWGFDGDKSTIKGFRIYRNAGGDSSSYTKLTDVLNVNATSYSDTVAQGKTYKYGVAVIKSDNSEGPRVNQSGAAVGPKPPTSTGSMNGKWTLDAEVTKTPDGSPPNPKNFYFFLDVTETSGALAGTVYFRDPSVNPPAPDLERPFGEAKLAGKKNSDGTYTFKMIEVSDNPATTDVNEERSWTVKVSVNAGSTAYTGTYTNVFKFEGDVDGVKVP